MPDAVFPSPKFQENDTDEPQLLVVAVNVVGEVASGVDGAKVKLTLHTGVVVTCTVTLADAVMPRLSVDVTMAVKVVVGEKVVEQPVRVMGWGWRGIAHVHVTGGIPPNAVAVRATLCPATTGLGLAVADTANRGLTDSENVLLDATPRLSVAVEVTVKAPAAE